jgi:MOSC domain-containing protein YiiM
VLQAIVREGGGNFGALCRVAAPGALTVGDPVSLLAPA